MVFLILKVVHFCAYLYEIDDKHQYCKSCGKGKLAEVTCEQIYKDQAS